MCLCCYSVPSNSQHREKIQTVSGQSFIFPDDKVPHSKTGNKNQNRKKTIIITKTLEIVHYIKKFQKDLQL